MQACATSSSAAALIFDGLKKKFRRPPSEEDRPRSAGADSTRTLPDSFQLADSNYPSPTVWLRPPRVGSCVLIASRRFNGTRRRSLPPRAVDAEAADGPSAARNSPPRLESKLRQRGGATDGARVAEKMLAPKSYFSILTDGDVMA